MHLFIFVWLCSELSKLFALTVKAFIKCPWPFLIIGGMTFGPSAVQWVIDTPNRLRAIEERQEQRIEDCRLRQIKMRHCRAHPSYDPVSAAKEAEKQRIYRWENRERLARERHQRLKEQGRVW